MSRIGGKMQSTTPQLRDNVKLSAAGLAANPELKDRTGVVESVYPGGCEVRFGEGNKVRWCWLKESYVELVTNAGP